MPTRDPYEQPLLPELPLGLGAAFLVMAVVSGISSSQDGPFLAGFFLLAGALSVIVAVSMRRRSSAADETGRIG